jgi:hypothetical protein
MGIFDEPCVETTLESLYGKILSVKFISYYKYSFCLEFTTSENKIVCVTTGGDRDDIYRYDPLTTEWDYHPNINVDEVKDITN